jgi:hypothetical protein
MAYATVEDAERWGKSPEEVYEAALRSFAPFGSIGAQEYDSAEKIFVVGDDTYASSLVLLPRWLHMFNNLVDGRPIAAVPERDKVIIAGAAKAAVVRRMAATALSECQAASRRLSPALYTHDEVGRLVPFEVGAGSVLANDVMLGQKALASLEYETQKRHLERLFQREVTDVFVASYGLRTAKDDSSHFAYCVWAEGIPSLLPEADHVVLAGPSMPPSWEFTVTWETLLACAGSCLERRATPAPTRWFTKRWPSADELRGLHRARVPGLVEKGRPPIA